MQTILWKAFLSLLLVINLREPSHETCCFRFDTVLIPNSSQYLVQKHISSVITTSVGMI